MAEEKNQDLPYFCQKLPDGRLALYLDNHILHTFSTCEQLSYYQFIMQVRRKGRGVALNLGSWWAKTMESFYIAMQEGKASRELLIENGLKHWGDLKMNELALSDPDKFEKFGGIKGAVLMAQQYYEKYAEEDSKRWKIISVEKGYGLKGEVLLGENSEVVVFYCGKPDRVIFDNYSNYLAPVDDKSVDRIDKKVDIQYKPHSQTQGYIFAINKIAEALNIERRADKCIINVCGRLPASKSRETGKYNERFHRVYPQYNFEEMEEWRLGIIKKATRLRYCIENEEFIRKESSCHIYGGCEMRGLCSLPPGEKRLTALQSSYIKVEPWRPYLVEETNENE